MADAKAVTQKLKIEFDYERVERIRKSLDAAGVLLEFLGEQMKDVSKTLNELNEVMGDLSGEEEDEGPKLSVETRSS